MRRNTQSIANREQEMAYLKKTTADNNKNAHFNANDGKEMHLHGRNKGGGFAKEICQWREL